MQQTRMVQFKKDSIPISCFQAPISCLEIIIKYLKENKKSQFKDIATTLNRKITTVYTTYSNSKKKYKKQLDISNKSILIPIDIFENRKYSGI